MKHQTWHTAIVHLGSNMGDREKHLALAIALTEKHLGKVRQKSRLYQTAAWGKTDQADFLNQAIEVQTTLHPATFLTNMQDIENIIGRKRKEKWGPRMIDIDLIFYDDMQIQTPTLEIPHPRMHIRNFVLVPLLDIIPFFKHPIYKQTIKELYAWCQDDLGVTEYSM